MVLQDRLLRGYSTCHCKGRDAAAPLVLDGLFSEKARNLTAHPALGRPGRVVGTRELVVHRNYLFVYDVTGEAVRILRVVHARRQWPPEQ